MKLIGYLRVSTAKQGQSGLGLDAQLFAIEEYAGRQNAELIRKFVDIESGQYNDRPELSKALHLSRVTGATLVIAKIDRLSRNAAFLLKLRDSGVKFIAADMPDANELTVGILALIAQHERKAISERTREALKAAKARGIKLGNPNGAAAFRRAAKGNRASLHVIREKAEKHAANLRPVIESLRREGIESLGQIAASLNKQGILSPRGTTWYRSSVRNLMKRIEKMQSVDMLCRDDDLLI